MFDEHWFAEMVSRHLFKQMTNEQINLWLALDGNRLSERFANLLREIFNRIMASQIIADLFNLAKSEFTILFQEHYFSRKYSLACSENVTFL